MALSARQISNIEKAYPSGLSSKEIIQVLDDHGEPLSEATLRKYVQLGLLPRSRRVGQKGKHRGSRGIYPVEVIRRVDEIRRAMEQGETLEELARASQAVRAKLSTLRVVMDEVLEAAATDLGERGLERKERAAVKAELTALKRDARGWMKAMDRWVGGLEQAERAAARARAAKTNGKSPASNPVRTSVRTGRAHGRARSRRGGA